MNLEKGDYIRCLDSLARFYNSQVTVHAGYLLTSVVAFFAVLSMMLSLVNEDLLQARYLLLLVFGLAWILAVLFTYFLARLQYYMVLSNIVWAHMGLQGYQPDTVTALKSRAMKTGNMRGVQASILSMFEAYLYVSELYRWAEKSDRWAEMPDRVRYETLHNLKTYFRFDDDHLAELMLYWAFEGKLFKIWQKTDLLRLAYLFKRLEYRADGHTCKGETKHTQPCLGCIENLLSTGSLRKSTSLGTELCVVAGLALVAPTFQSVEVKPTTAQRGI